jgi:hypothetical protein
MAIDRGQMVFFKNISFTDEDGAAIAGADIDSCTIHLNYPLNNGFDEADVTPTLDVVTDKFNGSWDSGVSDEGWVDGHLEGVSGDLIVTKDFSFKLKANRANERDE